MVSDSALSRSWASLPLERHAAAFANQARAAKAIV